jgi:hypothetical protein
VTGASNVSNGGDLAGVSGRDKRHNTEGWKLRP